MANAWIIRPLAPATVATFGSPQAGQGAFAFNDYAGLTVQLACDSGNQAVVRMDMGADVAVDTIAVHGVELVAGGNLIVSWATAAQGPFTGGFTTDAVAAYAGSVRQAGGKGATLWSIAAPVSARYWQIAYAPGASGQSVRIGRIVIGARIALARNFELGGSFGLREFGSLDFSARGVLLRRRGRRLRTVGIAFPSAYRDEVEAAILPLLERIGNTETITLVTDPAPHAMRERRMYHGPLVGDLGVVQRNGAAWRAQCNLVSLF